MRKSFRHIGKAVRTWRNFRGVSQQELAQAIGYKNGQFISNVERGLASFPFEKIVLTCEVLEIDTDSIVDAMLHDYKDQIQVVIQMSKIKRTELPTLPRFLRTPPPQIVYI